MKLQQRSGDRPKPEELIKDPTERFASPRAVLDDATLSVADKRRILESWVKDAQLLAEADTENMSGGEPSHLREAKLALAAVEGAPGGTRG